MEQPVNFSRDFESAVEIILQWDSTDSGGAGKGHIFECDRGEIDQYLQAVDEIRGSRGNKIMQIAVARLKEEFRNILISNICSTETDSLDGSSSLSTGYELQDDPALDKESISDLWSISERMSSLGYICDCIQVYVDVRKSFIDASFERFSIEKLSTGEIKRLDWKTLSAKIVKWTQAAKFFVQILFPREKQLCEQISEGLGSEVDDECFMRSVKYHADLLLNFAESVVVIRPSPEKLFKVLDLYNALSQLLPEIHVIFKSNSLKSIRNLATGTLTGLEKTARAILTKFENAVFYELSVIPVPGGSIHPLARYVMKYIRSLISQYKQNLNELVISMPSPSLTCSVDMTLPDMDLVKLAGQTPLAFHLSWIIVALKFNLEGKSKHYEDGSLAHLFMMNNLHYIVLKINKVTQLWEIVGNWFVQKLTEKFQQAMEDYQISTWNNILLPLDHGAPNTNWFFPFRRDTPLAALNRFYAMFESAHKTQAKWLVPDLQLRMELRSSILKRLIPAYKSKLDEVNVNRSIYELILHKMVMMRRKNLHTDIKYSVEDIKNAISDFFEGHALKPRTAQASTFG